ncbi:hypothetical protein [Endozoicomonas arenosclerae]|uniref:hypothetical protein n=1 Tax=Endozoicomonas arenosclerae TaxID=1633495 RepID=UPI0007861B93|nr:hypothetical protein [Endozoicomonas arenosclerae]
MAYFPEETQYFNFPREAYQPVSHFLFYPQPTYAFIPPPSVVSAWQSQWQTGAVYQASASSRFQHSLTIETSRQQSSHQARALEAQALGLFWGQVPERERSAQISHANGHDRQNQAEALWRQPAAKQSDLHEVRDQSIQAREQESREPWQKASWKDRQQTERFDRSNEYGAFQQQTITGYQVPGPSQLDFTFQGRRYTPVTSSAVYFSLGDKSPNYPIQPRDSHQHSRFSSNRIQDELVILPWSPGRKAKDDSTKSNYGGEIDVIEKPEPEQPEIRESYLLMNTISVVTLPTRTAIELNDIEISLDIDSFSWSLSGQLWGASSLALVEPDQNGPKQIEVDINGWKWVFIVERYTGSRAFGQEQYTVYGTSRTQLLASPYAPQRSKSNSSNINAKQAITEELQNTGFTALYPELDDFSTPDWIIPGGTFSYQNETPMKVVARLASTAGAVIIPARDSDQLNIKPRYPASPWSWSSATMDKIVPASMVINLSASWRPEPEYNAVYVSGTHAGVAVNVKRQGTAGDNPAPDILEDWLTETQVNTERGRNELAKGGHQSITTLEIPLTDNNTAPGLVEPGQLIEVQDINGNWRALCLSTSIRISGSKFSQSIELERHY